MSELTVFDFHGEQVRVIGDSDSPRFVGTDVLAILDLDRTAYRRLDDDEKGVDSIHTPGGEQNVTVVTESGLYSLILGSRKPSAREFKRWVTGEVLPQIRKTGGYGQAPALAGKELLAHAVIEAQAMIEQKDAQIATLAPKADAFDGYIGAEGDYSFNEAAKLLQRRGVDTGQYKLVATLIEWGWVYRGRKRVPRAKQAQLDTGRLTEKTHYFIDQTTGEKRAGSTQVRVTPKGVEDIYRRLTANQLVEVGA